MIFSRTNILTVMFIFWQIKSYVIRLPCKYEGMFLFRENLSYVVTTLKTSEELNRDGFLVLCTVTEGCMFFNYYEKKIVCVLLSSTEYPTVNEERLLENKGWIFGSTDCTTLNVS